MTHIVYLLVFYTLNITEGYQGRRITIPQMVSGPYQTEPECTEHLVKDVGPQTPKGGLVRDYECIAVVDTPTDLGEL